MLIYSKGIYYPIWDMTCGWETLEETSIQEDIPPIIRMILNTGNSGKFIPMRRITRLLV